MEGFGPATIFDGALLPGPAGDRAYSTFVLVTEVLGVRRLFRRKINYKQFEAALKLMAEKKYPGDDGGLEKLKSKILETGGPVAHGVTVKRSALK